MKVVSLFSGCGGLDKGFEEAGFDIICHGTNHALDQGKKGLQSCLSFWEEYYPEVPVLGIHGSKDDQDEIYVYEQDGVKIAILNF